MTDQRRRLTEFLGECWHKTDNSKHNCCVCGLCFALNSQLLGHIDNDNKHRLRTFLTWQDLGDVKEELVKKGLWEVFYKTTIYEYIVNVKDRHYDGEANMVAWLICPTDEKGAHFCRLVAEFLEARSELSGISEK